MHDKRVYFYAGPACFDKPQCERKNTCLFISSPIYVFTFSYRLTPLSYMLIKASSVGILFALKCQCVAKYFGKDIIYLV